MREFRAKKIWKRRLYSWPVLLLLLLLVVGLARGTWSIFQKERESQANLNRVRSQLANLESRNTTLSGDLSRLNTQEGVEDEIRSKYEVSKPGEEVVVIVDKNATTATTTEKEGIDGWWQKLLNIFKRN